MIGKKIIAPYCVSRVTESISNISFISISTDANNHDSEKMIPILIQYFTINEGICSKLTWKFYLMKKHKQFVIYNKNLKKNGI